MHSLSTLRSPGRPGTAQDSFPAGGHPWPDGVGCPQGPSARFPLCASLAHRFLLAQASPGAPHPRIARGAQLTAPGNGVTFFCLRGEPMATTTIPASYNDLMTQKKALAHLATLMPDGTP